MTGSRADFDLPSRLFGELANLLQTKVAVRGVAREADSVVDDRDFDSVVPTMDFEPDAIGLGVFADVVEGFADDANDDALHLRRETHTMHLGKIDGDRRCVGREFVNELTQRPGDTESLRLRRPQFADRGAHSGNTPFGKLPDLGKLVGGGGIETREVETVQTHGDERQIVGWAIVQLAAKFAAGRFDIGLLDRLRDAELHPLPRQEPIQCLSHNHPKAGDTHPFGLGARRRLPIVAREHKTPEENVATDERENHETGWTVERKWTGSVLGGANRVRTDPPMVEGHRGLGEKSRWYRDILRIIGHRVQTVTVLAQDRGAAHPRQTRRESTSETIDLWDRCARGDTRHAGAHGVHGSLTRCIGHGAGTIQCFCWDRGYMHEVRPVQYRISRHAEYAPAALTAIRTWDTHPP